MSELAQIISLLQHQIEAQSAAHKLQLEAQQQQIESQSAAHKLQLESQSAAHKNQLEVLCSAQQQQISALADRLTSSILTSSTSLSASIPKFSSFDSTSELWKDYYARFMTFVGANSIPDERLAKVFLTNQSTTIYKLLDTLAAQQTPSVDVNDLTLAQIRKFMEEHFDPRRFIVRERFKFWANMKRKPGETIQELAARIRQDAATCDFSSIQDPQDEAMRTRFMCSINNEAVLKALFKVPDNELTFSKAIQVALETEEAAKVAKETIHGSKTDPVMKIKQQKTARTEAKDSASRKPAKEAFEGKCIRCGKVGHAPKNCYYKNAKCHYCQKIGHIEAACLLKKKNEAYGQKVSHLRDTSGQTVIWTDSDSLQVTLRLKEQQFIFEVDTGSKDNFCSVSTWDSLGKPELKPAYRNYYSASEDRLPVKGYFCIPAGWDPTEPTVIFFNVIDIPNFNVLGRKSIRRLNIDVNTLLKDCDGSDMNKVKTKINPAENTDEVLKLQRECNKLCNEFSELFKPEIGCLKDFELEIAFKSNIKPVFCKPRTVAYHLLF